MMFILVILLLVLLKINKNSVSWQSYRGLIVFGTGFSHILARNAATQNKIRLKIYKKSLTIV